MKICENFYTHRKMFPNVLMLCIKITMERGEKQKMNIFFYGMVYDLNN